MTCPRAAVYSLYVAALFVVARFLGTGQSGGQLARLMDAPIRRWTAKPSTGTGGDTRIP